MNPSLKSIGFLLLRSVGPGHRTSLNECRVLGDERFKNQIEAALKRSVRAGQRGGRGKVKMALQIQIESDPNLLVRAHSVQICRQDWL